MFFNFANLNLDKFFNYRFFYFLCRDGPTGTAHAWRACSRKGIPGSSPGRGVFLLNTLTKKYVKKQQTSQNFFFALFLKII